MTTCFRKFGRKRDPALEFLANNNTMWSHFFPKFCTLILKFSYIFSNFANGNVNFSTFETIWLILTLRHTFNEEIWTISQQNITLLLNFSSKLISHFRIFGQKVYPGKWHIPRYPNIASTPRETKLTGTFLRLPTTPNHYFFPIKLKCPLGMKDWAVW